MSSLKFLALASLVTTVAVAAETATGTVTLTIDTVIGCGVYPAAGGALVVFTADGQPVGAWPWR